MKRRKIEKEATVEAVRSALKELEERTKLGLPSPDPLLELVKRLGNPGAALAQILARDADGLSTELALLLLLDCGRDKTIPATVRNTVRLSAVTALMKAMKDGSVPDQKKLGVVAALQALGVSLQEGKLRAGSRTWAPT